MPSSTVGNRAVMINVDTAYTQQTKNTYQQHSATCWGTAVLQSFGWQNGQPILRPLPFRAYRGEILAASVNRGAAIQRPTFSSLRSVPVIKPDFMSAETFSHVPVMAEEIVQIF